MTIQIFPTGNAPFYTQTSTLEGTNYLFSFQYASREDDWYMSIADANGVDIVNGIKIICANWLLFKCVDPRRPPGQFLCQSSTSDLAPPGLNDLVPSTGRCALYYFTSDIIAQILAGTISQYQASLASNTASGTGSTYGQ